MAPVIFFHTSPALNSSDYELKLNWAHLHLFNGQNTFARRRLAAEHGIKFGFVVRPKPLKFAGEELKALQGVVLMEINQVLAPYATWM